MLSDVVVGDVVFLKSGMEIPGDGIVFESYSLLLDESSMTGETCHLKKETI